MENKNLGFFKNIGIKVFSYFAKNKENNLEKEKIKLELQEDFENFLVVGDVLFCLEMVESGYNINKNQKNHLAGLVEEKIYNKELSYEQLLQFSNTLQNESFLTLPFLFDYMRKNNELDKSYVSILKEDIVKDFVESFMDFMTSFKCFYKNGLDILKMFKNYNKEELKDAFEIFNTYTKMFKELYSNGVMNGESFMSFNKHLEITINEIKSITSNNPMFNNSFENIKMDYLEKVRLEMRDYAVNHTNINNKVEVLNKLKKLSKENIEKEIKNLAFQRSYSITQLEQENQQQIKEIENLTEKINKLEVNEFVESRLPVILEKYLSIDKEYRNSLKNVEGYNAKELMTQSLNNIILLLNEKLENKNSDFISELSIENRKLKARI